MKYNIVISGPSGAGKGTLIKKIMESSDEYIKSVSCTTRNPRPNEENGKDYFFVDLNQFKEKLKNDEIFEAVEYDNNFYGILNEYLKENNKNKLFDLVIDSGLNIKEKYPENTILIYILPQDLDRLNLQRGNRGIDRLKIGKEEIKKIKYYDFIIINDTPDNMLTQFNNIIKVVQQNSIISQRDFIDGFYNEDTNKVLKLSKGRV